MHFLGIESIIKALNWIESRQTVKDFQTDLCKCQFGDLRLSSPATSMQFGYTKTKSWNHELP